MTPSAHAQLAALAQEMIDRDVCPELREWAFQLVMGHGNPQADIVFIGEAPGKQEDLAGRPFLGASGKFLNTMLAAAQLERDDVYITNIVKYRPPNNRDPLPAEKAAFSPYLAQELAIVKPKVIMTLGRHSMEYFLPEAKISQIHGQLQTIELNGEHVVLAPLYHPGAALRNGSLRQTLLDDFLKVMAATVRQ